VRVLFLAGYENPAYQRKVDLLADAPDVELVLLNSSRRLPAGRRQSASGQRSYTIAHMARAWGGSDPHRSLYWPPGLALRRHRPDVIHCEFEQESLGAAQAALVRRLLRPHAALILYAYQNILRPRRRLVRAVSRLTLRAAPAVVCASQGAADVLRQQGYTGQTPILPVLGIDTNVFHPGPGAERAGELVIGYAGRLAPEKDLPTLLRAAAQMRGPARLIIAGEGSEAYALATLARELGIAQDCEFRGPVGYGDIPVLLRAFDVLVLPSRTMPHWKEQFGRVLVEAMACGVVVVGSSSGAIPEVLGGAGVIFPEGDAPALAQSLDDLAQRPEERRALRERGLARVREHYTVQHIAAEVLALWRRLAA